MQRKWKTPLPPLKLTLLVPISASSFSQQNCNGKAPEDLSTIYPYINFIMQLAAGLSNVFV